MSKQDLVLIGAGGHSRSCVDVIEAEGKSSIAGFVGTESEVGTMRYGYKVSWRDKDLTRLRNEFKFAMITIGSVRSSDNRIEKYRKCCELGFEFPRILSPFSRISRQAILGPGTIVMHGVTIYSGVVVGRNCILNSHSLYRA